MNEFHPSPLRAVIRRSVGISEDDSGRPLQAVVKAKTPAPQVQRGPSAAELATAVRQAVAPLAQAVAQLAAQVQRAGYVRQPSSPVEISTDGGRTWSPVSRGYIQQSQALSAVEIFGGGQPLPVPQSGPALTQRAVYEGSHQMNVRPSGPMGMANALLTQSRQGPTPAIHSGQQRPAGVSPLRATIMRSVIEQGW